jgi:phosphoribulokinase
MNVLELLPAFARTIHESKKGTTVVMSIAGAGCLGKTTFAERFGGLMGESFCQVVGIDGYMLERHRREEMGGITGYDPRGFELIRAKRQLLSLIHNGTPFILYQYNRITHKRDIPQRIMKRPIVLLEGGLSQRPELAKFTDIKIFFEASKEAQFRLRLNREQREFGYTAEQVYRRFESYHRDYLKFIAPAAETAHIVLRVSAKHEISVVRSYGNRLIRKTRIDTNEGWEQ